MLFSAIYFGKIEKSGEEMVDSEEKLKAIEKKLKEHREFGCGCTQEIASDLLMEFFSSEEVMASPMYKKIYGTVVEEVN